MKKKLHILVMIAFLGSIIAPACGFMWGGNYSVVEICTAQGFENRIVINEGQSDTPSPHMYEQCEFCFSNTHITTFLPNIKAFSDHNLYTQKLKLQYYETILLSRINTDISSRGPPTLI